MYTNLSVHVLTKNQLTKTSTEDFIFPNTSSSEGYDRGTHIEPQLFLLCTFSYTGCPEFWCVCVFISEQKMFWVTMYCNVLCTSCICYWQSTLLPRLLIRCTQHIHVYKQKPNWYLFCFVQFYCFGWGMKYAIL